MVDLSAYVTKQKSDEGVIFPVKIKGRKYPLAIRIYGTDSDVYKEYERNQMRKLSVSKKEIDQETLDDLYDSMDEKVYICIGGVYEYDWKKKTHLESEIVINGKTVNQNREGYEYLCEQIPDIKDFVLEKAKERSNFLSGENTN